MGSKKNLIAAARKRLGLSQPELGRKIGSSAREIQNWEAGKVLPGKEFAAKLQAVLGLSDLEIWRVTHRPSVKVRAPVRKERIW